jgi:glycosyltransferase involved in cell wall biosynthesis
VNFVASRLQKISYLPWIAEFRDLWSHNPVAPTFSFEEDLEKSILKNSSHLVAVSSPIAEKLYELHHKPVTVIHNGFDEEDYLEKFIPHSPKFTIVYTGTIHPKRDPSLLLRAVQLLRQENRISPENFEAVFYGPNAYTLSGRLKQYGVRDLVSLSDRVTLAESRRAQMGASVLLLLECTDSYTAKVFEYLGARRPILSVGLRHGVVERLMQETRAGVVLDSSEEIAALLRQWLEAWQTSGQVPYQPDDAAIKCYTRKEQARQMATVLDEVYRNRLVLH